MNRLLLFVGSVLEVLAGIFIVWRLIERVQAGTAEAFLANPVVWAGVFLIVLGAVIRNVGERAR